MASDYTHPTQLAWTADSTPGSRCMDPGAWLGQGSWRQQWRPTQGREKSASVVHHGIRTVILCFTVNIYLVFAPVSGTDFPNFPSDENRDTAFCCVHGWLLDST